MANINSTSLNELIDNYIDPSFGSANIDQETVDGAIDALIKLLAPTYLSMINEAFENLQKDPDFYRITKFLSKESDRESMKIPVNSLAGSNGGEHRYYAKRFYKIDEIDPANSLDALLIALSKRLAELKTDFVSKEVEIRFEKGCFFTPVNYWHFDGEMRGLTTTICYSNKKNWSTRILDTRSTSEMRIFGPDKYGLNLIDTVKKKLELLSRPSTPGAFYHPQAVIHRSPSKEDFKGKIKADDYRLFLRFYKE